MRVVKIGEDWTLPLDGTKPLSAAVRAKRTPPPQFPAGATLSVVRTQVKKVDAFQFDFPQAEGVYDYRIVGTGASGQPVESWVYATDQTVVLAAERFGEGPVTFAVTPVNSLGEEGEAIVVVSR